MTAINPAADEDRFSFTPFTRHPFFAYVNRWILERVICPGREVIVDLGTSSVGQTRDFARQLAAKGASWADAPIARTRQAAQDGTLSVMVGTTAALYAAIEPLIRCFATDVTHCGDVAPDRQQG